MEEENKQILKDQLEEIKKLLVDGKQEISNVQDLITNAKQLLANIENYNTKFSQLRESIENPETGLSATQNQSANIKAEIASLRSASEEELNQIKASIASVQSNVQEMNAVYLRFNEIKEKIENPEDGLSETLQKAHQIKSEIGDLLKSSEEEFTKIEQFLTSVQANVQQMNAAYTSFQEIEAKITDSETGLAKILETSEEKKQEIIAVKKQADGLFQEIKKFRDEAQGFIKDIEALKTGAEENKAAIEEYERQSRDAKEKIEKIYKIATDAGLANSFDQRKIELKKSTNIWSWAVWISTGVLMIALVVIFWPYIKNGVGSIEDYTWYRLTLTSPLIFFITFASFQYNKERNLLEKYAFKSVTALSLEGYTTLLINTFGKEKKENEEKILDFVLNSMGSIYREPHDSIKESKMSFGIDGKFATLKADIVNTMEETKDKMVEAVRKETNKTQ